MRISNEDVRVLGAVDTCEVLNGGWLPEGGETTRFQMLLIVKVVIDGIQVSQAKYIVKEL